MPAARDIRIDYKLDCLYEVRQSSRCVSCSQYHNVAWTRRNSVHYFHSYGSCNHVTRMDYVHALAACEFQIDYQLDCVYEVRQSSRHVSCFQYHNVEWTLRNSGHCSHSYGSCNHVLPEWTTYVCQLHVNLRLTTSWTICRKYDKRQDLFPLCNECYCSVLPVDRLSTDVM